MLLTLDIGNTATKIGEWHEGKNVFVRKCSKLTTPYMQTVVTENKVKCIACAASGGLPAWLPHFCEERGIMFVEVTGASLAPIKNDYTNPRQFGGDRWAAAVGAFVRYPKRPLMVCSCGTCLTADFIDEGGTFRSGSISPGVALRMASMHEHTRALPLVMPDEAEALSLTSDTVACMWQGVKLGVQAELKHQFSLLCGDQESVAIAVLTGGDAPRIMSWLPSNHFVYDPTLIHLGLKTILSEYEHQ